MAEHHELGRYERGLDPYASQFGIARDELEALVTLLPVYAGFPRASAGMEVVRDELTRMELE